MQLSRSKNSTISKMLSYVIDQEGNWSWTGFGGTWRGNAPNPEGRSSPGDWRRGGFSISWIVFDMFFHCTLGCFWKSVFVKHPTVHIQTKFTRGLEEGRLLNISDSFWHVLPLYTRVFLKKRFRETPYCTRTNKVHPGIGGGEASKYIG